CQHVEVGSLAVGPALDGLTKFHFAAEAWETCLAYLRAAIRKGHDRLIGGIALPACNGRRDEARNARQPVLVSTRNRRREHAFVGARRSLARERRVALAGGEEVRHL